MCLAWERPAIGVAEDRLLRKVQMSKMPVLRDLMMQVLYDDTRLGSVCVHQLRFVGSLYGALFRCDWQFMDILCRDY